MYRDNLLKKVEQIENPEPLDLYGEHGEVDEDVGRQKSQREQEMYEGVEKRNRKPHQRANLLERENVVVASNF